MKEIDNIKELFNDFILNAEKVIKSKEQPAAGWYKTKFDYPKFLVYSSDGITYNYGFNCCGDWSNDMGFSLDANECVLADPKEVNARLIKEAKRRGFKKGVKYNCPCTDQIHKRKSYLEYCENNNWLADGYGGCVFEKGIWAEIIEQPLTLNGKEVYFDNDYVWIGNKDSYRCNTVMNRDQLIIYAQNAHINKFEFNQGESYTFNDMKQLLTKIESHESTT